MAYVWHMTVGFLQRKEAEDFVKKFDDREVQTPNSGNVHFNVFVSQEEWYKQEGNPEVFIMPMVGKYTYLNGHGGPGDAEEYADCDAVAKELFSRLKKHTEYTHALLGTEVGYWRSISSLREDFKPGGFLSSRELKTSLCGLTLSKRLWQEAQEPLGFEPFSDTHVWYPWTTSADHS